MAAAIPMHQPVMVNPNPGNDSTVHVQGYPDLASFFSQCTRYLHLRRFSALAVRLLLYRQHELMLLEKDLLELEKADARHSNSDRRAFCHNFSKLKTVPTKQAVDQKKIYERLKLELKDYEEALIRFDRLGEKGFDLTELSIVQYVLGGPGTNVRLTGIDASIWGSIENPKDHAHDLIQVTRRSPMSSVGKVIRDKFIPHAPSLPSWLFLFLFWKRKRPGTYQLYNSSNSSFEVFSLTSGNLVASLLIYAAMTSLYLTSNQAARVAGVVALVTVIAVCSMLFRNHQFVAMMASICAVLVTLLLNDDRCATPKPTT